MDLLETRIGIRDDPLGHTVKFLRLDGQSFTDASWSAPRLKRPSMGLRDQLTRRLAGHVAPFEVLVAFMHVARVAPQ